MINKLLEEGRLSELGTIVIDELHMVGDQSRGYLLELMLTKLRYAAGEGNVESSSGENSGASSGKSDPARGLQIIGMSATLPNVAAVADWLQLFMRQNFGLFHWRNTSKLVAQYTTKKWKWLEPFGRWLTWVGKIRII